MIKGILTMALDFARGRKAKGESGRYSYRKGGQWYVVSYGPTYSNVHKVTEFDEEGERWLIAHEKTA